MQRMIRDNARILGWWTPVFLPMCWAALLEERGKTRVLNDHTATSPEHEWLRTEWCKACQIEADQEYIQYRDEEVVTRQCMECLHLTTWWDNK